MFKKIFFIIFSFIALESFVVADIIEYEKATYEGQTFFGDPHGRGEMTFTDGEIYTGQYKFGLRHGRGSVIFPDGSTYVGQYSEGIINGAGVYTYSNGSKYTGMHKEGLFEGKGRFEYADGRLFEGTFKNDWRYEGILTLNDGTTMEGIFPKEGKTDGKYNITYEDGSKEIWTFKDGEFVE